MRLRYELAAAAFALASLQPVGAQELPPVRQELIDSGIAPQMIEYYNNTPGVQPVDINDCDFLVSRTKFSQEAQDQINAGIIDLRLLRSIVGTDLMLSCPRSQALNSPLLFHIIDYNGELTSQAFFLALTEDQIVFLNQIIETQGTPNPNNINPDFDIREAK